MKCGGGNLQIANEDISSSNPLHVSLATALSELLDRVNVFYKGSVSTVHNAITATAVSVEVDCRNFSALLVYFTSTLTDKTWTLSITGSMTSGGTFVPLLNTADGTVLSSITTDISGFFVIDGVPDYVKITATEVDDGATVTVKVQPFNH